MNINDVIMKEPKGGLATVATHLEMGHNIFGERGEPVTCSCGAKAWADPRSPHGWDNRSNPTAPDPTEVPPTDEVMNAIVDDLRDWWHKTSEADFTEMEPKIGEYTASDLVLMGQFMEHWMGLPPGSGAEAATLWYALGKVARAVAAYREGRLPSDDTLHDLSVYAMMARRIRETGRWP